MKFTQQCVIENTIAKAIKYIAEFLECNFDRDRLAKVCGFEILAVNGAHRAYEAHLFHFVIRRTELFHKVDAGFFEPADVVRMMYERHLVGFVVLDFVGIGGHCFSPCALLMCAEYSIFSAGMQAYSGI